MSVEIGLEKTQIIRHYIMNQLEPFLSGIHEPPLRKVVWTYSLPCLSVLMKAGTCPIYPYIYKQADAATAIQALPRLREP